MTKRKPSSMQFPDWVEHQIQSAHRAGEFDNLPGAGKPIPGIDSPQHELAWVANYLRRENVDVAGLLPPGLSLAKERERLPERLLAERTERDARAVVRDLNERISRAHAAPQVGPPFRVKLVDEEAAVDQWREARAELLRLRAEAQTSVPVATPPSGRRRWFRRGAHLKQDLPG